MRRVIRREECLPHACGGVSHNAIINDTITASSPRLWGCFLFTHLVLSCLRVFPTPVGVFLNKDAIREMLFGLPHACGGVSEKCTGTPLNPWSSPRLWGCFQRSFPDLAWHHVFPTPVGVFLLQIKNSYWNHCLPHACGGVSVIITGSSLDVWSSPRLWGCFLGTV